jgi:hypothetical protein
VRLVRWATNAKADSTRYLACHVCRFRIGVGPGAAARTIWRLDLATLAFSAFATGKGAGFEGVGGVAVGPDGNLHYVAAHEVRRVVYVPQRALLADNASAVEGGTLTFEVVMSAASAGAVTVDYATVPATATAGEDYVPATGTLTFATGQTRQPVVVQLLDDGIDEEDVETLRVTSTNAAGALVYPAPGTGGVLDDDQAPLVSGPPASVPEGNQGATSVPISFTLSSASGRTVRVNYATRDASEPGAAKSWIDYIPRSGQVVIPAGAMSGTGFVTVNGDTVFEGDEVFLVDMVSAENAFPAPGPGDGRVTILNDDTAAARVFASVEGSDLNDCRHLETPCRTLDEAAFQAAAGGEVIVRSSGSYAGATLRKSVTLNVPKGIVALSAAPIVIDAGPGGVVVVRGLTVKALQSGIGAGVAFNSGDALFVEGSVIDSWDRGIDVTSAGHLFVSDTTVRNSWSSALRVAPASSEALVSIDRSRLEGTRAGCGLDLGAGARGTISSSVIAGNRDGVCTSDASSQASVHRGLVADQPPGRNPCHCRTGACVRLARHWQRHRPLE